MHHSRMRRMKTPILIGAQILVGAAALLLGLVVFWFLVGAISTAFS